jgi:hypothetical protein
LCYFVGYGIIFLRNKIKGNIAEVIFQSMFSENEFCTVIPFGYEKLTPLIAQYQHLIGTAEALENIRNAPDFILVKPDNTDAVLVDVKYRKHKDEARVKEMAAKLLERWETAWLFLASLDGFYFAPCEVIVERGGDIPSLPTSWIGVELQESYLELLREFEK